jgi:hypothetical protein
MPALGQIAIMLLLVGIAAHVALYAKWEEELKSSSALRRGFGSFFGILALIPSSYSGARKRDAARLVALMAACYVSVLILGFMFGQGP